MSESQKGLVPKPDERTVGRWERIKNLFRRKSEDRRSAIPETEFTDNSAFLEAQERYKNRPPENPVFVKEFSSRLLQTLSNANERISAWLGTSSTLHDQAVGFSKNPDTNFHQASKSNHFDQKVKALPGAITVHSGGADGPITTFTFGAASGLPEGQTITYTIHTPDQKSQLPDSPWHTTLSLTNGGSTASFEATPQPEGYTQFKIRKFTADEPSLTATIFAKSLLSSGWATTPLELFKSENKKPSIKGAYQGLDREGNVKLGQVIFTEPVPNASPDSIDPVTRWYGYIGEDGNLHFDLSDNTGKPNKKRVPFEGKTEIINGNLRITTPSGYPHELPLSTNIQNYAPKLPNLPQPQSLPPTQPNKFPT